MYAYEGGLMNTLTPKKRSSKKKTPEIARLLSLFDALELKPIDIAKDTGVSERTIMNFIWNNSPIGGQLLRNLHLKYGVSIDWLVSGRGAMFVEWDHTSEPGQSYEASNPRSLRIVSFIDEFMQSASLDEQAWLEVQLKFAVPPYRDFLGDQDE